MAHIPVLLNEVLDYLDPKPGQIVLDTTLGTGGHSKEICKKIGKAGKLIAIDRDNDLLKIAKENLKNEKCEKIFINDNFGNIEKLEIDRADGVLFDLGMNSLQIEQSGRGFSFLKDEPLSMNMKSVLSPGDITAREILNTWSRNDIFEILKEYGEEKFAKGISENIVKERKNKKFKTTFDLVEVIEKSVPDFYTKKSIHFATKTFQALRIAVNNEMEMLEKGLAGAWRVLKNEGVLAVISFHSLEDRIVKRFMRSKKDNEEGIVLTKKPTRAREEELEKNPRSRSAKLRAIIKIK